MKKIMIKIGSETIRAELLDTPTARAISQSLPIISVARTWGQEVYFQVPVSAELEPSAKDVVTAGELAFWVEGACIAIGFGPTPISQGNEIRLAAKTNIWAQAIDDVKQLISVKEGDRVEISADAR